MTTVNTSANITTYLSTLTPAQLTKELERVRNVYQGEQVRSLPEQEVDRWEKHIELIEDEIERRG